MTWEKQFVLELFLLSSDIQLKHFGLLLETSRHCCRKSNLRVENLILTKTVFLLLFCHELLTLSKKFSTFWCKSFRRVFDTASYVSRGAMTWGKHLVLKLFYLNSDIQTKQFSLLVETSRHCCKSAVYVSRGWVWRKPFFCYFLPMNCSYWAKNFWLLWVNIVVGFLKLHPTCPEEQWIEENIF